jgi:hypothetical protein
MKRIVIIAIILVFLGQTSTQVHGSGTGSVLLQIQGYGTLHGQLQDAIIQTNDSIAMRMTIDDQIQTTQGSFPVQATGAWYGVRNGPSISGTIRDVVGKIAICIILSCNDAEFLGQGNWAGSLDASSNGSGNFTGTIAFTKSPYAQIPTGQSIPAYGSWIASFSSPLPELQWDAVFAFAVLLTAVPLTLIRRRTRKTENG